MPKLLYFISEDWFFCSHFMDRARAARVQGYEVAVLTRVRDHGKAILDAGFSLLPINMDRSSLRPDKEIGVLLQVWRAYREAEPDVVHHIALKPIIYGSVIARVLKIRAVINAPVGMGYVFTSGGGKGRLLRAVVQGFLRQCMNPPGSKVVFENEEDLANCVADGSVRRADTLLIEGAGVDTDTFSPRQVFNEVPVIIVGARMLRDKGIFEFAEAARMLRDRGLRARFWLVGAPDPENPSSIPQAQLQKWNREGVVEWFGHREDMAEILSQCDVACLPSYREGLPKFLIEAMACGLPVVSTVVPGCRQAVVAGVTGVLVPPRDPAKLAQALSDLVGNPAMRQQMGAAGRRRALTEYSRDRISGMTIALYDSLSRAL